MSDSGNPYDPLNTTSSSGVAISTDGTMADDSDDNVSTEKAIVTYIEDTAVTMANKTLTSPVINTGVSGTAVLDEDDMTSDSATQLATQRSIKKYVDDLILTAIYPVNTIFVQWPIAESNTVTTAFPSAQAPATLYGGTWSQLYEDEAVFFRTEGTHLEASQDTNRTNGLQTDQGQGHYHNPLNASTAFMQVPSEAANLAWAGGADFGGSSTTGESVTDGTNGTPREGLENYPVNRLIRLWRRTA